MNFIDNTTINENLSGDKYIDEILKKIILIKKAKKAMLEYKDYLSEL